MVKILPAEYTPRPWVNLDLNPDVTVGTVVHTDNQTDIAVLFYAELTSCTRQENEA